MQTNRGCGLRKEDVPMGLKYRASARSLIPVVLASALAGCGSFGAVGLPWQRAQTPAPLGPATQAPVESATLPPVADGQQPGAIDGADGNAPLAQPQVANNAPAGTGQIGRTDLLGGWTIASGGDSCQLFMTLTSWTGGYRASTRGCSSTVLKSISAWNLQGPQVILAGQGGTPVAHLASSGTNRFDGQVDGQGTAVAFYR
jgi:hypothetical protein